jgi:hypothetical protein
MAQYLALIHGNEQEMASAGEAFWAELHEGHNAFAAKHGAKLAGGNALQGSDTATTIRNDGGGFAVTDGPFAEAKEVLGGYYLLEAADLDEAIAIAKDIPMPFGGVEVRPIRPMD